MDDKDDKAVKPETGESEDKQDSDLTQFKSEHQLAKGFVQQLGQALIQWLPVGSSGFILASFLLQQNWLMVVVTLPITAIAVFWASFTETLLSKIKEIGRRKRHFFRKMVTRYFRRHSLAIRRN
ncbi:MAG: hypothetical protein ACKN9E_13550 [Microcystaceae cyanobacterium]